MKKEKMKRNIFFLLQCVFTFLTFIGAISVIRSDGKLNAGYAVIPMMFSLVFGMFVRNSQNAIKEHEEH